MSEQNNQVQHSASILIDLGDVRNNQLQDKKVEILVKNNPYKIRKKTTIGFQRAQWSNALQNTKHKSVWHSNHNEQTSFIRISPQNFRAYSPGICLFFKYTKSLFFLFLILSIFGLIPTVYNAIIGENYNNIKESLSKYLGLLSIGNLKLNGQIYPSLADKLMNAIPTFLTSLFFFIFYLYWNKESHKEVEEVRKSVKLLSYKVVEVVQFPKDITEEELFSYLSKFAQVKQIAIVKNYNDTIFYSRKIFNLTLDAKQMVLQRQQEGLPTDQTFQTIISKKENELEKLYEKLTEEERNSNKQILKFFVTFQSPQQRQQVVQIYKPFINKRWSCFRDNYPEQLKIRGERVHVKACHTEPAGIIWQNVHITWKTRWLRLVLQVFLILLFIFIGFCFILILNVLNPPVTTSAIDSSIYNSKTIMSVSDMGIVQSWCLANNDLVSANTNSDYSKLCGPYLTSNVNRILISIAISIAIMTVKYILKYVVLFLSKFLRYKTHQQQAHQMINNLFITYTFTTVILTIFMQARFTSFMPKDLVKFLSSNDTILLNLRQMSAFQDLSSGWYLDVGYQIFITWIVLAITPPFMVLAMHYPLEKIRHWMAQKKLLQRKMEQLLEPQQFQIFDHYSNLQLFIIVGFILSPGMPCLLPLVALGVGIRYLYLKYIFIRFCKIPKPIDQQLNNQVFPYLIGGLVLHLCIAICMYGNDQMFDHKDSFIKTALYRPDDSNFTKFWYIVFKRCVDSWYLTALLAFYLFFFFLKTFITDIYRRITNKQENFKVPQNMLKETVGNGGYRSGITSEISLTKSYKIQNNIDYLDILAIIQRRKLAATYAPKK